MHVLYHTISTFIRENINYVMFYGLWLWSADRVCDGENTYIYFATLLVNWVNYPEWHICNILKLKICLICLKYSPISMWTILSNSHLTSYAHWSYIHIYITLKNAFLCSVKNKTRILIWQRYGTVCIDENALTSNAHMTPTWHPRVGLALVRYTICENVVIK